LCWIQKFGLKIDQKLANFMVKKQSPKKLFILLILKIIFM